MQRRIPRLGAAAILFLFAGAWGGQARGDPAWGGYGGDPQHSAISSVASQPLAQIHWSTPVDLQPQHAFGDLLIHYGSPLVTAGNTVIVPVKTGLADGFQVEAFDGATGAVKWTATTDYSLPPHGWTPSYGPVLTPQNRLYYPGAGGTVYYRDTPDAAAGATGQIAFFGNSAYAANAAAFNQSVQISTPITSDNAGNIYFGYRVSGSLPAGSNLTSGIARIAANGTATYIDASAAAFGNPGVQAVAMNSAPALSHDGQTVYVTLSQVASFSTGGYLAALNSATLQPQAIAPLNDPRSGSPALMSDYSSASPTVAPNGDVYIGVLENPFPSNNDRGWLLHFSADLSQSKTPGAFGWDDTASIVPASMVPSYHGTSSYLLMTKYNNYAGAGTGDGNNKLAILDPSATMIDPITGASVMQEVLTIAGVTPDGPPPGLREWCVNTAAVDPATDSILVNSEDGRLYRWNLATNTFTESITLTAGVGEAYTPTLIGADGTVYAINDGTLFAVGAVPEPTTITLFGGMLAVLIRRSLRRKHESVAKIIVG